MFIGGKAHRMRVRSKMQRKARKQEARQRRKEKRQTARQARKGERVERRQARRDIRTERGTDIASAATRVFEKGATGALALGEKVGETALGLVGSKAGKMALGALTGGGSMIGEVLGGAMSSFGDLGQAAPGDEGQMDAGRDAVLAAEAPAPEEVPAEEGGFPLSKPIVIGAAVVGGLAVVGVVIFAATRKRGRKAA